MLKFFGSIIFLLLGAFLQAESFVLIQRGDAGMFSMLTDVIAALDLYEKRYMQGLTVDFGTEGLYFDPKQGANWWNYYFEPIAVGRIEPARRLVYELLLRAADRKFWKSRREAHALIQKYIRLRPEITRKIEAFKEEIFSGFFVIGVHYPRNGNWIRQINATF